MSKRFNKQVDIFAIDSQPLEISKITREQRNTMGKGYIVRPQQNNLFETAGIQLEVQLRNNQQKQKPVNRVLKKARKIIETFFRNCVTSLGYNAVPLNPLLALSVG